MNSRRLTSVAAVKGSEVRCVTAVLRTSVHSYFIGAFAAERGVRRLTTFCSLQDMPDRVAGWKTCEDWEELKITLQSAATTVADWEEAYSQFFLPRLQLRYLDPISVLQENGTYQGEGFSIAAIQCSLIEFLESTWAGTKYRYSRRGDVLDAYEYSSSSSVFTSFLTNRTPFAQEFNQSLAQSFYEGVRCALLHEARTRNGWRIVAKDPSNRIVNPVEKTLYRDGFQAALLVFVSDYKAHLLIDATRQAAFIRKFDDLCA